MEQNTGKNAAIRVENLVKTFKDVRAVDGISFKIGRASCRERV